MSRGYLIDNSAWVRLAQPGIPTERRAAVSDAVAEERVYASALLRLEAGYSAVNGDAHAALMDRFDRMPNAVIDAAALSRSVDLQSQLARVGHHRVPIVDLVTIAVAEANDLTVLHYDKDYDVVRDKTDAVAEAEWLAPRGSL